MPAQDDNQSVDPLIPSSVQQALENIISDATEVSDILTPEEEAQVQAETAGQVAAASDTTVKDSKPAPTPAPVETPAPTPSEPAAETPPAVEQPKPVAATPPPAADATPDAADVKKEVKKDAPAEAAPAPVETPPAEEKKEEPKAKVPDLPTLEPNVEPKPVSADDTSMPTPASEVEGSVPKSKKGDLLDILGHKDLLKKDDIAKIRMEMSHGSRKLEELILKDYLVDSAELSKAKAELFDIPFIHPNDLKVAPDALTLVPQSVAKKFAIMPFDFNKATNELSVAMADAADLGVINFLEQKTGTKLKPFAAPKDELEKIIEDRYGTNLSNEVSQVIEESQLKRPSGVGAEQSVQPASGVIRDAPISKIVSYILNYAVQTKSSDVHIEPQEERTRVRFRIDGILYEKLVLPNQVHNALVSRIKILGSMKIDERRVPQDGRFNFKAQNEEVDLRVSSLPTVHGEKIVMRLLKKSGGAVTLSDLGFRGRALKNLEDVIERSYGIVLVTGPTGSGKTTTLYSVITKINTPKVNILTLEDPVEYQMSGVNQVQINAQAGLTFASGLRSFLRQDPNVIMVGEIRDQETAELAIQAALTGHLVFSTLHTNSSAGALPRLLDMGAEPFLLSSTINAVVAQRVVRTICDNCKVDYEAPKEVEEEIKESLGKLFPKQENGGAVKLYKGEGCSECGGTGYKGRIGIFEVLPMSEKISRLVMEREPASKMEEVAIEEGMIVMKQDGFLKVLEGITTMEEVLRVAQS